MIAGFDNSGCFDCGNRETTLCWLIVIFLFIYMAILNLGLILTAISTVCCYDKFFSRKYVYTGKERFVGVNIDVDEEYKYN